MSEREYEHEEEDAVEEFDGIEPALVPPIVEYSEELRYLAAQVDGQQNPAARMRLIAAMDILLDRMRPAEPEEKLPDGGTDVR